MSDIWNAITGAFEAILVTIHDAIEPLFGDHAWGWAIIALTLAVRILLLPLAIKQTRSMRAMQELQPKIKALQKKYKTDRDLMRKDPELYRKRKQKLNEETMALYKEEGVNPASGCLPLLAQMPIFFALFSVLRGSAELVGTKFHFFTSFVSAGTAMSYHEGLENRVFAEDGTVTEFGTELATHLDVGTEGLSSAIANVDPGLDMAVSAAGWPGWLLIVLMGATMFITQRQLISRNTSADPQQQQTQKIMMYVMPVFLAFISFNLPLGVLVYWVTTNLWQVVQQQIVLREAAHAGPTPKHPDHGRGDGGRADGKTRKISDHSSGAKKQRSAPRTTEKSQNSGSPPPSVSPPTRKKKPKKDHLPPRPGS
ncbi:MAG: YidC/Oxa1 family membrane protein insertase [Nitriliruptorales bacterium]|nr:YidC/Oxa1 family membrane protein insertase [Nitriliruptorales bacterium]